MIYEKIFKDLAHQKIRYLVIGGIAVNLHGFPRVTGDLDIAISLDEENLRKFVKAVKRLGWRPRIPVALEEFVSEKKRQMWIEKNGMKVFTLYNPKNEMEQVDVMVERYIDFEKAYGRRRMFSFGNVKVPVVSIPDLIRLKEIAGRERDATDIKVLKQIMEMEKSEKKSRLR